MKKTIASICAVAVAAVTLGAGMAPAEAAALPQAQLQLAAMHHSPPPARFEMRGHYAYYNGHRGDRHRHAGWREYNGYWFPPSAFIGAVIGGAIVNGLIHATH